LHEQRYRDLAKSLENNTFFKRTTNVIWQCQNCGHELTSKEAPKLCPVCAHPQSYFQELPKKNY
jgi:rubrerythrin